MNLEALESFRIFAETLNFTRAAERRFLTQPALHKQIQNLASELGVDLYAKDGRSLFLTRAGIDVARFARETHERVVGLKRRVHGEQDDSPITISAGRGGYLYLLGAAIRDFQHRHPGLVRMRVDDSGGTLAAVRSGLAHLGVTVLLEAPADLSITPVREVVPHLIVANGHPLAKRKKLAAGDLDDLPLMVPPDPSPLRESIRAMLGRENKSFNVVMDAPGWELAMHFVSLGMGATVVNGCCRPPRGTRAIPLRGFPSTTYYLVEHPSGVPRRQHSELRERLLRGAVRVELFGQ